MYTGEPKTNEENSIDLQKRNHNLQEVYSNNRKNLEKRKELRKNRLRQINQYRDEQVAALKH